MILPIKINKNTEYLLMEIWSAELAIGSKVSLIAFEPVEVSTALLLNRQNQLICARELARGTVAENTVYIREIVKLALDEYASALIFAHNHPGGSAIPSDADIRFTHRLQQALRLVDIDLLDHFIVTAKAVCSLREGGWLK